MKNDVSLDKQLDNIAKTIEKIKQTIADLHIKIDYIIESISDLWLKQMDEEKYYEVKRK